MRLTFTATPKNISAVDKSGYGLWFAGGGQLTMLAPRPDDHGSVEWGPDGPAASTSYFSFRVSRSGLRLPHSALCSRHK